MIQRQARFTVAPSVELLAGLTVKQVATYGYADLCFAGDHTLLTFDCGVDVTHLGAFTKKEPDPIKEIVLGGMKSVPFLLAHLDDMTPTAVQLLHPESIDDYYDASAPGPRLFQHHLSDAGSMPSRHNLTVGDLSYFLLGQIVNRNFDPLLPLYPDVRYPVFNGPSATLRLAAAAKSEWGGLTEKALKTSLVRDVLHPVVAWRDVGAMRRLLAYFPGKYLEDLALRRLRTPLKELDLDSEVSFYANRVRRHEVLVYPRYISPYQFGIFLLGISDLKSRKVDSFLRKKLEAMSRRVRITNGDDRMAILIIARLHVSGGPTNRISALRFCKRRMKNSSMPDLYEKALQVLAH